MLCKRSVINILFYGAIAIFLVACLSKNATVNIDVKHQMQTVDSLMIAGKRTAAMVMLKNLRPKIENTDPAITTFYCFMAQNSFGKPAEMQLYADSAFNFFADQKRTKQYPTEYLKTLLTKGDACFFNKQYGPALDYYSKGREMLSKGSCDNGEFAIKIAGIYFKQKNYRVAAQYWLLNYNRLEMCQQNLNAQKLFFLKASALNNAGYGYQSAGMLDSAAYYYQLNLNFIDQTEAQKQVPMANIQPQRIILYDNLGGVNLLLGNLKAAENYLNKSLAIPHTDVDGMRIPPYLKLAELYMQTGRLTEAAYAFSQSKVLLTRYRDDNLPEEAKWDKLYAQFMFKKQQPAQAYQFLNAAVSLRDSLDNSWSAIFKLDVNRELQVQHQQEALMQLKQQDKLNQIYIAFITLAAVLSVIIMVLIYRNLKKSRRNNLDTSLHNRKLHQTLAELERANKNYIRIMRVMAHDLRNPLSGMMGLAASLFDEEEFSEESKYMLKLIETTGMHSIEMINELLKSGLADEHEPIEKQRLDLNALLNDSVELLQFKANEKQQQIIFEDRNEAVFSYVNYEKMWRVFNNLIVNAIKFSYIGGMINVGLKITDDGSHILIWVADNGIGIPAKDSESIFEMFTAAKKPGTSGEQPFGLGLSISKKIIEKHQGKIWFESMQGTGTIFYIELPA